jgi:Leucine-rich repeat (LRR) protein
MTDLNLIKQLEKEIGIELKKLPLDKISKEVTNGYALNEKKQVIGINLDKRSLTSLPNTIPKFQHLSVLSLYDNNLTTLPESITNLVNLTSLNLVNNKLTTLPESITNLVNLTSLDLRSNQLTTLPESITNLVNLTSLDLSYNQLTTLPESITNLVNLTSLNLYNNKLTTLPESIGNLTNLKELILYENKLTTLPESITNLVNLTSLNLWDNQLTTLPESITNLVNLASLNLAGNQLTTLPESITKLVNLTSLDLSYNQLTTLPESITILPNLKELILYNNPIKDVPPEILGGWGDNCLSAVLDYMSGLKEGEEFIYEAKLILVGDPAAGKTSLRKKLLNPGYQLKENEPMTKGIEIEPWQFALDKGKFANQQTLPEQFTANIWDFGGQEIMHATHRYFLTKRSLYVLLDDMREERTNFFHWLNMIEMFSEKSPVLIVQNNKHGYIRNVSDAIMEKFKDSIKDVYLVNLKDNKNLASLSVAIREYVQNLDHVGREPIPKKWIEIRDTLRKKLSAEKRDTISFSEYMEICGQVEITDEGKARRISDFLHDLGVILHFQEPLLDDTIILNTAWATEAVYLVQLDETIKKNCGKFDYNDLKRIWKKGDCRYDYPKKCYPQLLTLMEKFLIAYEIGNTKTYIIPKLLPENPGNYGYQEHFGENVLHFEFRYPKFKPPGLVPKLIVKKNEYIYDDYQWEYGVVLKLEGAMAEIIEDDYHRKISLRIVGEKKKEALYFIRLAMNEIHNLYHNLPVSQMIPCNCDECKEIEKPHFYEYQLLEKYRRKGIDEIRCDESLDMVNVNGLIEGVMERDFREGEIFYSKKIHQEKEISSLSEQLKLLDEKLSKLSKAFVLENDPATKFKIEKQIKETKAEREEIEKRL